MLSVVRLHDLILALVKYLDSGITTIQWLQILRATYAISFIHFGHFLVIREVSVHFQLALLECTFSLQIASSRGASLHVVLRDPLD